VAFPSNEEETLLQTVANISRQVAGFDSVEIMIIDDDSSDRTIEVAREIGVDLSRQNLNKRRPA
jgi:glycosyltransferase involved in cell wall biosynthesis